MIRSYSSSVHSGLPKDSQIRGMSQEEMNRFNKWNQNIATQDGLANGDIPVSGSAVSGAVQTNAVGIAPATSVAVKTTNMMVSQNFTSSNTVAAQAHWSWDGTDGNLTLGCARVQCDGRQDDLVSNEIPVVFGENILVACQVKWEGIDYTGDDPITLGVERYRKGRDPVTGGATYLDLGGVDVATLEAPADDGGWGTDGDLAGTYQVEAGVDLVRARLRPAHSITSGVVKWDEVVFLKLDLIDDAAVPGVGTTVDDIVRELFGSDGNSFTHNEAAVALGNTSAALTSANARLAQIEAQAGTGAIAGDDFLWSGEITSSSNWGGTYTETVPTHSYYEADGTDAVWHSIGALPLNQTCKFDWQGTDSVSDTDYQLVQLLLASGPVTNSGFKAYVHLLGRISTGFGSFVRASFGSDGTYAVSYWNGSSFIGLNSGTCAVPGMGAVLSLYCGDKATSAPRRFKLVSNTVTVAEFNEIGTGSPLGASNRKWGWGAEAEGGSPNPFALVQGGPPKVNQWLGYDQ